MNCTTPAYDRLYAPWLSNPGNLLDLANYKPGDILLDLAGGTGAVSKDAAKRISDDPEQISMQTIHLYDLNPRCGWPTLSIRRGRAEEVENHYSADMFDVVVCRQAIGYINMVYAIPGIYQIMKTGGRFVFNSFKTPSRCRFRIKKHEGVWFAEGHLRIGDHVFHTQARLNRKPGVDFTWFKCWSAKELHNLLKPWFSIDIQQKGQSFRWICTKG
ncbi:MAG: class I SAM-dependent methyltransferase [Bacteroidales bacterium]|nr:class I SAM-dependent methyltransferase [Bacteroidales bacterium]